MAKSRGVGEAQPGVAGKAFPAQKAKAEKEGDKLVRVRATRMGYYGNARKPKGTEFDYVQRPGEKLPSWVVEVVDAPAAETTATAETVEVAASDSSADVL